MSLTVTFTNKSTAGPSGPITAYEWDFGDPSSGTNNASTAQSPTHTFSASGTYDVTLTITGTAPDGTATVTHSVTVSDTGTPPGPPPEPGGTLQDFIDEFVYYSDYARPTFTPVRNVRFVDKPGLDAAILDMRAGDYIYYDGSGVLHIESTKNGFNLTDKRPSGPVVINFGCMKNMWDAGEITPNYVSFKTSGRGWDGFVFAGCSNIRCYGGEIQAPEGRGLRLMGPNSHCLYWDVYIHNTGGTGVTGQAITVGGATSYVTNCDVRAEVERCCLDPSLDGHADKGTGIHGCLLHGNSGHLDNNRWMLYAHNPLQPGEYYNGIRYPEGAGGSIIEVGQTPAGSGNSNDNNKYIVLGYKFKMICNGTNPGSNGAKQTGGNVINWWGDVPQNNAVFEFAAGYDISGQVSHGTGGHWHNVTSPMKVNHGRSYNTNQAYPNNGLSSATDPYDRRWGIEYAADCT